MTSPVPLEWTQDNVFISWAHLYAMFQNPSDCWVCGALPLSSIHRLPWLLSLLEGPDFQKIRKVKSRQWLIPLLLLGLPYGTGYQFPPGGNPWSGWEAFAFIAVWPLCSKFSLCNISQRNYQTPNGYENGA